MNMSTAVGKSVVEADVRSSRSDWLVEPSIESVEEKVGGIQVARNPGVVDRESGGAVACSEMGDAVLRVASDERILSFNEAAVRFFVPFVDQERLSNWTSRLGFSIQEESQSPEKALFPFHECLSSRGNVVRDLCCRSWWKRDVRRFRVVCMLETNDDDVETILVVLRDLSELKRTKELVGKLQLVDAECPYPTLQVTPDGKINQMNPAARNLLNTASGSISVFSLMPDIRPEEVEECINNGGSLTNETEIEGRIFQFVLLGMPKLGWAHVYGFDVSSFRETESGLKAAKVKAESTTRMKSEFLANMSNEIQTPMNGILGMASFLMDSDLDEQQREFADTIHSSGESLLAIINDILDFSKLEAQRLHLENVEFELSRVVGDTMDLLARQGQTKGLEILADIAQDVPDRLVGDPVRLRQILNNLIGNAIKFTEKGEVELTVSCVGISASGIELEFVVSDSGIGIPTTKIEKLFRPFSQAESSTTRKYGGTGLGLVISKNLVELMEGRMKVESTLGKGSQFSFSAKFGCRPNARRSESDTAFLVGRRVLIVDENDSCRRVMGNSLNGWSVESQGASSLADAISKAESSSISGVTYDAILLDSKIAQSEGLEALRLLRGAGEESVTKTILLGGVDDALTRPRFDNFTMDDLLAKPVKPSKLFDCLRKNFFVEGHESSAVRSSSDPIKDSKIIGELSILLVEDNLVNIKVATEQLRRLGLTADCARNGAEALKMIEKRTYDVALMDCQMPVLDGFQATSEVRSREREQGLEDGQGLHIIAMTANAMDGDRERCLASGMSDSALASGSVDQSESIEFTQLVSEVGAELAREILDAFVEDSRVAINELRQGVIDRDSKSILRRAHTLKGASATCVGRSIVYTCLQIETFAKEGEFSELGGLVEELSQELEIIFESISRFRADETSE
jgi:signal transduction histidine kinase/DNA-binding response OmpR family regulator/HPt (histidine-containing phosphotransfer) domain-containing protein